MSATETGLISQLIGRGALHIEKIITVDTAVQKPVADMLHVVSSGTYAGVDKELYIGYPTLPSPIGMFTDVTVSAFMAIEGVREFFGSDIDYVFGSFSYDNSTFISAKALMSYDVSNNLTSYPARLFAVGALKFRQLNEKITEEEEILPAPKTDLARLLLRHRESVRREGGKFRDVAEILAELEASRKRAMVL